MQEPNKLFVVVFRSGMQVDYARLKACEILSPNIYGLERYQQARDFVVDAKPGSYVRVNDKVLFCVG